MVGLRGVQKSVGTRFNQMTPLEGNLVPLSMQKKVEPKYKKIPLGTSKSGKKARFKKIVLNKANQMLLELDAKSKPYFEEMLKEINVNPGMAIEDIAVIVVRRLTARDPKSYYAQGAVKRLYQMAVKNKVIELS